MRNSYRPVRLYALDPLQNMVTDNCIDHDSAFEQVGFTRAVFCDFGLVCRFVFWISNTSRLTGEVVEQKQAEAVYRHEDHQVTAYHRPIT